MFAILHTLGMFVGFASQQRRELGDVACDAPRVAHRQHLGRVRIGTRLAAST
jgi:hypothetical protein